MNLGEGIATFRLEEDDNSVPYQWSSVNLTKWFNEAENEAAFRAGLILDSGMADADLPSGESSMSIHSAIYQIDALRLIDSGGAVSYPYPSDRIEQDRINRDWRATTGKPTAFIHDDKHVTFNRIADMKYTVQIDAYRMPLVPMSDDSDEPEIALIHHARLVDWVRYKAYSVPDTDFMNMGKAESSLAIFEAYFGRRPQADAARSTRANRPHRIKAW